MIPLTPMCPPGSEPCADGVGCVLQSHLCDGEEHCQDGSDERPCGQCIDWLFFFFFKSSFFNIIQVFLAFSNTAFEHLPDYSSETLL